MCNTEQLQDGGKSAEDIFQRRRSGLVLIKRFLVIPEPCRIPDGPPGLSLLPCSGPQEAARAAAAVQKQHPGEERKSGSVSHDHHRVKNSEFHKKAHEEPLKAPATGFSSEGEKRF